MRLFSKKEINSAQAKAQRQTYEEGMKLARRVDGLREVAAAEDASLEKFRRETIATIHEETIQARKERDELRTEVSRLKKEREEALEPLDQLGERLAEEENRIKSERSVLEEGRDNLTRREQELDERARAVKDDETRLAEQKRLYSDLLSSASDDRTSARTTLETAKRENRNVAVEKARLEQEVEKFEASRKATEERQAKRDKEQDEREVLLNRRETRVLDRDGTYKRKLERDGN